MLRFHFSCKLKHIPRANEIGIDVGPGIFKTVANAGLGREMHDDAGPCHIRGTIQCVCILKLAKGGCKAGVPG